MLSLGIGDVVASRIGRKTIAMILAIVPGFFGIFGLGHIYLGAIRRGIAILAIGIGLILIAYPGYVSFQYAMGTINTTMIVVVALVMAGLAAVGFWIWQILDARKIAKQQAIEA
jgi:TM2 domain-containing membrane protein YozV